MPEGEDSYSWLASRINIKDASLIIGFAVEPTTDGPRGITPLCRQGCLKV